MIQPSYVRQDLNFMQKWAEMGCKWAESLSPPWVVGWALGLVLGPIGGFWRSLVSTTKRRS